MQHTAIDSSQFYSVNKTSYCNKEVVNIYARKLFPERTPPVKKAIETFVSVLPEGASILDIGSGTGKDVAYLRSHGFHAHGIDFSNPMIELASIMYGNYFSLCDIRDFNNLSNSIFNGIMCIATLQHIHRSDLTFVIKSIRNHLISGGAFLLMTKEGIGEIWDTRLGPSFKRATTLFTENELSGVLEDNLFLISTSEKFDLTREGETDHWISILSRAK